MRSAAAVVVGLAVACSGGDRKGKVVDEPPAPAPWPVPDGWRSETIPFPLEFAPELPYQGVEELRFPKEFFTVGHEDYFAYAFVWDIAAPGPESAEVLERDLVAYFAGLAKAVGGPERADIAAFETKVELSGEVASGISGTVDAFDAFKAEAPVRLQMKIWSVPCPTPERVALVFVAAPQRGPAWERAERLAAAFRCQAR